MVYAMRKLLLALALISGQFLWATHLVGGHLSYVYVSSTATTVTYNVRLRLIADQSGAGLGLDEPVNARTMSGAGLSNALLLRYMSVFAISSGCGTAYAADYRGDITLPKSQDVRIVWNDCCRASNFTSIVNSTTQQLSLEAMVKASSSYPRGYDNGVIPMTTSNHTVVAGVGNYLPMQWSESDGDSVYVSLAPAQGYDVFTYLGTPVTYASGYTWRQPIPNAGGADSLILNQTTSTMHVVPNVTGKTSVVLRFNNYVWDTTSSTYQFAGYSTSEVPVSMLGATPNTMALGIGTVPSSWQVPITTTLPFYSISLSGSEFTLESNSGQPLGAVFDSVRAVDPFFGPQITLFIDTSLVAGNYQLRVGPGVDSNTLVGQCGAELPSMVTALYLPFDSASIHPLSMGSGSGSYILSNATNIDSVTWSATGAQLSQNSVAQGLQFTTTNFDSIQVAMYAPFGELRALRHGAGGATLLTTFALTSGIGTDEPSVPQSRLHPNPTSGTASLVTDLVGTYELFSVFGALLERGAIPTELDFSRYPQGVYLLALTGDGRTETLRIVRR